MRVEVRSRAEAEAFTTLDGSTIRVLLDRAAGGAANQSLAEATVGAGGATRRHYHAESEEIYVLLEGRGEMEVRRAAARRAGRRGSHPARGLARDPSERRRRAPLPLLLRSPVRGRGHVL